MPNQVAVFKSTKSQMELANSNFVVEERLTQFNKNRKEVSRELREACSKVLEETEAMEEKINREILVALLEQRKAILSSTERSKVKK